MASRILRGTASLLEGIAGFCLTAIMLITSCDIVGRIFGVPVPGTFEVVSVAAGLIIGLAVPMSSLVKAQVTIDAVTDSLRGRAKECLRSVTRLIAMCVFALIAYALLGMGNDLRVSGEATSVLGLPLYPVAYAMGAAFVVEVVVLGAELLESLRALRSGGTHEVALAPGKIQHDPPRQEPLSKLAPDGYSDA
ncbi:MAG: TRAP transporter small permease [Deltaproteobacteria bacterium]|nr:TRAP transporter small permease [Deltaproteobacteria bacterium]